MMSSPLLLLASKPHTTNTSSNMFSFSYVCYMHMNIYRKLTFFEIPLLLLLASFLEWDYAGRKKQTNMKRNFELLKKTTQSLVDR